MKNRLFALVAVATSLGIAGCGTGQPRFKSVESYENAVTPNDYTPVKLDPGSFGGIGEASGGTQPALSYGTHSADDPFDGSWDHYVKMAQVKSNGLPDDVDPGS